jgi:ATP-dependent DNA helicase PIF1
MDVRHWRGTVGKEVDGEIKVSIPEDLLIKSSGNTVADMVDACYPNFLEHMHGPSFFRDRAILAPTNDVVDQINDFMIDLMPGEVQTYFSADTPCPSDSSFGFQDSIHTPEFLNTIKSSGIPNHEIRLKIGVPIMLIVTRMEDYVLEATITIGDYVGKKVLIPRISLTPSDHRIPFKFRRRQFAISISYAMTINKSQGNLSIM